MILSLFKGLLARKGKAKPVAQRIVYSLPDVRHFSKFFNKDTFFKDIDPHDWLSLIDGFQERFEGWYFSHMHAGDSAYLDICALAALVEVGTYYSSDKDWHDERNYKEFLRRLNSVFRRKLSTPIRITRFKRGQWQETELKDYADVFYTGVRCSLHHHGDLASYSGMKANGNLVTEIPNAGKSTCGQYSYPLLIFDPVELRKAMVAWFKSFCDDLRANPTSDGARRFKQKFETDFGISLP